MTLQLKQDLSLILSQDSGTVPKIKLADFSEAFTDITSVNEGGSMVARVDDAQTDQQLSLGTVSAAKGMAIISDREVDLKLNDTDGTDRSITLIAGKVSVLHAEFSALYITNASGFDAYIRYAVWGD